MVYEFRTYSYYHDDRTIANFRTGYIEANSIDDAIDLLYLIMWFDDSVVGHCVRESTRHIGDRHFVITGEFPDYSEKGIPNPSWAYLDPREWTKEGFSFGTPRIRMG